MSKQAAFAFMILITAFASAGAWYAIQKNRPAVAHLPVIVEETPKYVIPKVKIHEIAKDISPSPESGEVMPSIESLKSFAGRFAPLMARNELRYWEDGYFKGKVKISPSILSTDIKKSDSLAYPVVGEIVFSLYRTIIDDEHRFTASQRDRYSLTFAFSNGKWTAIKGVRKCEAIDQFPRSIDVEGEIGRESAVSADSLKPIVDYAQEPAATSLPSPD